METRMIRTAWQPVVKVWRRTETGEAPRLQAATYRGERGPAEAGHHAPRDIRSGRSLSRVVYCRSAYTNNALPAAIATYCRPATAYDMGPADT